MKATSFEDLRIWQNARELSKEIYRISRFTEFSKDYRFVGQITSAMGSVMDNIAEGFDLVQDEDGAWYKLYTKSPEYQFQYNVQREDTYVLVVEYPEVYKSHLVYSGVPENIEVAIYSEQRV